MAAIINRAISTAINPAQLVCCIYDSKSLSLHMGQILLRNVDDGLIDTLKRRAAVAGRSMEAEAREALERGTKLTPQEKKLLVRRLLAESEALKVPGVVQTPGWLLIREDRDSR